MIPVEISQPKHNQIEQGRFWNPLDEKIPKLSWGHLKGIKWSKRLDIVHWTWDMGSNIPHFVE